MKNIDRQHEEQVVELILFFKYMAYDMSEDFLLQYIRNMEQLKRQLEYLGRK